MMAKFINWLTEFLKIQQLVLRSQCEPAPALNVALFVEGLTLCFEVSIQTMVQHL